MPRSRAALAIARRPAAGPSASERGTALSIGLSAVIVAASVQEPRVLTVRIEVDGDTVETLPSGPLEAEHRTLEIGLRSWVERQTRERLGYVEQLYTFGDRDRVETGAARPERALTVAYLALVRQAQAGPVVAAAWQSWYRYFPWEDWRLGKPAALAPLEERLVRWVRAGADEA